MSYEEKIWQVYPEKIAEIAEYLVLDESMRLFFNNLSKEEIIAKLNEQSLRTFGDNGILTYYNHSLDDIHIIDLEFDDILEKFLGVSIDG